MLLSVDLNLVLPLQYVDDGSSRGDDARRLRLPLGLSTMRVSERTDGWL